MGTSDFAVASLKALAESGEHEICAVVSQPDKPKGRGYVLTPTPVKAYALQQNLEVFTPETLKDGALIPLLEEKKPECIVVASYGKILPEYILSFPEYGCVNVHASLLPEYRGAAPINAAIIDGKKETGITTMLMDAGLDTGDMLLKSKVDILDSDDAGTLHDKLAEEGGKLLLRTLKGLWEGSVVPQKQEGQSSYAHMITAQTRKVDFSAPARKVFDLVRGLSPVPTATAVAVLSDGRQLGVKLFAVEPVSGSGQPGKVIDSKTPVVACGSGAVKIVSLRPDGKNIMSGEAFARGYSVERFL